MPQRMKRHHLKRFSSAVVNNTSRLHPRAGELIKEHSLRARPVDQEWDKLFGFEGFGGIPRAEVIKKLESATDNPMLHFSLIEGENIKRYMFYNNGRPKVYRIVELRVLEEKLCFSIAYANRELAMACHMTGKINWVQIVKVPKEVLCKVGTRILPTFAQ